MRVDPSCSTYKTSQTGEITIDTVRWIIGAVLIAIGIPLYFLARYFDASEDLKKRRIRDLKTIAVVWMSLGVIIYLVALILN
jgi:hypothetical protein